MFYKKFLFMAIAIFGIMSIINAQKRSVNSRAYEKINNKWYQVENGFQYEVNKSIITIKFKPGVSESQKNSIIRANNCILKRTNILGYYDLQVHPRANSLDVVSNFLNNSLIDIAEPNTYGEYISPSNDTYYGDQWHLQDENTTGGIDAFKAWDKENGNPNVVIGILDSGTDILHQDLKGNIWVNPGEDLDGDGIVWDADDMNGIDDDGNGKIDDLSGWDFENNNNDLPSSAYHGTHVAGIAGAETNDGQGVAGVAGGWAASDKGCNLLIGAVGSGAPDGSVLDDAILYAAQQGVKVISMSLTVGSSQAITDAINTAYNTYGCFVNNASGNGNLSYLRFPANVENCFAVGASFFDTDVDSSYRVSPDFGYRWGSNYGEGLMILAPGVDIKSTRLNNSYGTGGGTSYASPQVAATAGLIASYYPDFTVQDIEKAMCLTAEKISPDLYTYTEGYEYGSWNNEVGYGKLNADRALGIKGNISSDITLQKNNYLADEVRITNNATLTLANNSTLYFLKSGRLIIEEGATLVIEDNVFVEGENSSNKIVINGTLHINNITNISFTGNSYLEINGNITAETGASISLRGRNNSDEVLKIKNKFLELPANLSLFKVTNGKIVMEGTSRIKTNNANTSVYMDNIKLTSSTGSRTGHFGIYLYHTQNATIKNSTFENGRYGLYSFKSGSDPNLYISNCIFNNCTYGLVTYGRGLVAGNCEFTDNYYGWYARFMTASNNLYSTYFEGNRYGIKFQGYSTSHILLDKCSIDGTKINKYDGYRGVYIDGPLTIELKCSRIKDHQNAGIYLRNYASVDLSPSRSDLSNNKYAIYAYTGDKFYLYYGYNNLKPNTSITGAKCMSGKYKGLSGNVYCYRNIWKSSGGAPVQGSDYSLTGITLIDYYPRKYFSPGNALVGPMVFLSIGDDSYDPTGDGLDVREINTPNFKKQKFNKAVGYVFDLTQSDDADAELNTLLLSEILSHPYKNMNNKEQWYIEYAYNMFKKNVGAIDLVNNNGIYNKAIHVQNKLHDEYESEGVANKEYKKALFRIGKADFHNLAGRTDKAYSELEKAINHTEDTALTHMIRERICYLDAEIAIEDSMLDPEELDAYLEACLTNTVENKSASISNKEDKENEDIEKGWFEDKGLKIYPNPVTGQSQILTYSESEVKSVIKIYDISGRIVYEYVLNAGDNIINIDNSAYSEGIYQIVLFENGVAVNNSKMVIVK